MTLFYNLDKLMFLNFNLRTGAKTALGEKEDANMPGINFHFTGILRTKPGRGERTESMSCSDKLCKWNLVGLQGALVSHFLVEPIFIDTVVICGDCDRKSAQRALFGRIDPKNFPKLDSKFTLNQPKIVCIKENVSNLYKNNSLKPCCSAISWTKLNSSNNNLEFNAIAKGGKKLGSTKNTVQAKFMPNICRYKLFELFVKVVGLLPVTHILHNHNIKRLSYNNCKTLPSYLNYKKTLEYLKSTVFINWTEHDRTLDNFYLRID